MLPTDTLADQDEDAEKVIGDRQNSGSSVGVSNLLNLSDGILGDILNIHVIATFNMDKERIDSALLRKGRFDEIFFVDLPKLLERKTIFKIHLEKRNRNPKNFNLELLADLSESFTGAEIEAAIEAALYEAFSDNKREIITSDIADAIKDSVPISKLMKEEIQYLRSWASERARNASSSNSEVKRYNENEDDL